MDVMSKERRSWTMSRIKGKDTVPERIVRSWLHREGFRFRLHVKRLPGCPDVVLPRYKTVIDVRGCFWHRHPDCPVATMPKSHMKFWWKKFNRNVERDIETEKALARLGWRVIVVWACELRAATQAATLERIRDELVRPDAGYSCYEPVSTQVAETMPDYLGDD